jgi:hypothetical protein
MDPERNRKVNPIVWAVCIVCLSCCVYALISPILNFTFKITYLAASLGLIALSITFESWRLENEKHGTNE